MKLTKPSRIERNRKMNIEIKITADAAALEFSRNLGGIGEYFKEALMTNAMEEHGLSARELCEPENLKVEIPVEMTTKKPEPVQTIESDPLPFAEEGQAVQVSAEELRAKGIAFSKAKGKDAMRLILDKLKVQKMSDLDANGRALAAKMIDEASNA